MVNAFGGAEPQAKIIGPQKLVQFRSRYNYRRTKQDINYEKREEQRKDEEEMLQGYKGFKEINPEFYLRKVPDPLLKPSFDQLSKERVNEALLIYECDVRARLSSTGLFATYRMIIGVGKVDFYTYDHVRKQIFLTPDTFFQIIPPEVRACCSWLPMQRDEQEQTCLEILDLRLKRAKKKANKRSKRTEGLQANGRVLAELHFESSAKMYKVKSMLNRAQTKAHAKHSERIAELYSVEAIEFLEAVSGDLPDVLLTEHLYEFRASFNAGNPSVHSYVQTTQSMYNTVLSMTQPSAIRSLLGGGTMVDCVEHLDELSQNCERFRVLLKPRWIKMLYFCRREWIVKRFIYYDHKANSYVILFKSEAESEPSKMKIKEKQEQIASVDEHSTRDHLNFLGFLISPEYTGEEITGTKVAFALSVQHKGWAQLYPRAFTRDLVLSHMLHISQFVGLFEQPPRLEKGHPLVRPPEQTSECEYESYEEEDSHVGHESVDDASEDSEDEYANDPPANTSSSVCLCCFGSSNVKKEMGQQDDATQAAEKPVEPETADEEGLRWEMVEVDSSWVVLAVEAMQRYEGIAGKLHVMSTSDSLAALNEEKDRRLVVVHLTFHLATLTFCFATDAETIMSSPEMMKVWKEFTEEEAFDNAQRASKTAADVRRKQLLHVQPTFVYGAALVKRMVGEKPSKVAVKYPSECFLGQRYVEVDVDMSQSKYVQVVFEMLLHSPKLVLELAFMLDDGSPREEGVVMLGCVRLTNPSVEALPLEKSFEACD